MSLVIIFSGKQTLTMLMTLWLKMYICYIVSDTFLELKYAEQALMRILSQELFVCLFGWLVLPFRTLCSVHGHTDNIDLWKQVAAARWLACCAGNPAVVTDTVGQTPGRGRVKGRFQFFRVNGCEDSSVSVSLSCDRSIMIKITITVNFSEGKKKKTHGDCM